MSLFDKFGLSDELRKAIKGLGITKPTSIQEQSIPHIIEGKDVIGESATGSGITLTWRTRVSKQPLPLLMRSTTE